MKHSTGFAPLQVPPFPSTCDLCGKTAEFHTGADGPAPCPGCGASLGDRALTAALCARLSNTGAVRMTQLIAEKHASALRIAACGMPFSPKANADALFDFRFSAPLTEVLRPNRSGTAPALPMGDAALDAFLLSNPAPLAIGLREFARVLKPGGLLMVTQGLPFPLPPTSHLSPAPMPSDVLIGEDAIEICQKAGLFAFIDRPCANIWPTSTIGYLVAVK